MPRVFQRKRPDVRIDDTLAYARDAFGRSVRGAAMAEFLGMQVDALDKAKLSEVLSLGSRFDVFGRGVETERRRAVRAVLMGYAALGNPDGRGRPMSIADVATHRERVGALTKPQLDQELQGMMDGAVSLKGTRVLVGMTTSLERASVDWAIAQVENTVTKCQMALGQVPRDGAERQRMQRWFGSDPQLHAMVRARYGQLLGAIRNGILLIKDDTPGQGNTFAYVYVNRPAPQPVIYLCGQFWRAGQVTWASKLKVRKDGRDSDDNPLGVIIHELTHVVLNTKDYRYGRHDCQELARNEPVKARDNADNYEYFAESVQLNR